MVDAVLLGKVTCSEDSLNLELATVGQTVFTRV